jgi:hypothetical protein
MCQHRTDRPHQIITRRLLLKWSARMAAIAAALGSGFPVSGARAQSARYGGRLIDAHSHLNWDSFSDAEALLRISAEAGVDGVWIFSVPWTLAADAASAHSGRVVPFLAEGYLHTLANHSSYLNLVGLEQVLSAGAVRGLGEIILRHSAFALGPDGGGAQAPATHVPATDPRLVAAYRLAGRMGVPVNVHQEWFFSQELGQAVDAAPETSFVWAHAGHGPASVVSDMLAAHPNLHADLSARTPWIGPGTVLLRPDGSLDGGWRTTLERFPDRFLIGLDLFAPAHYRVDYARRLAEYYRGLLGQLTSETAELIAYRNAERLAPAAAQ